MEKIVVSSNDKKQKSLKKIQLPWYFILLMLFSDVLNKNYIHELKPWEECAGKLLNITQVNNLIILSFNSGINICFIGTDSELINKLKESVGKTISILKTDIVGKEYLLKIFGEEVKI